MSSPPFVPPPGEFCDSQPALRNSLCLLGFVYLVYTRLSFRVRRWVRIRGWVGLRRYARDLAALLLPANDATHVPEPVPCSGCALFAARHQQGRSAYWNGRARHETTDSLRCPAVLQPRRCPALPVRARNRCAFGCRATELSHQEAVPSELKPCLRQRCHRLLSCPELKHTRPAPTVRRGRVRRRLRPRVGDGRGAPRGGRSSRRFKKMSRLVLTSAARSPGLGEQAHRAAGVPREAGAVRLPPRGAARARGSAGRRPAAQRDPGSRRRRCCQEQGVVAPALKTEWPAVNHAISLCLSLLLQANLPTAESPADSLATGGARPTARRPALLWIVHHPLLRATD